MSSLTEQLIGAENNERDIYKIGQLSFDANLHSLASTEQSVYLRHQLNYVLLLLAQNTNRGVSRKELINTVWHGNTLTGQKALTHTICKLRHTIESLTEESITIVTIPKFGYSLISRSTKN